MPVDIDVRPLRAAAAVMRDGSSIIADVAEGFVEDMGPEAQRAVRARARRHRKTGDLERRITLELSGAGDRRRAVVVAGGPIAPIILGGSDPHPIQPLARRALSFTFQGARTFARRVHHPGTAPDPFVELALEDMGGAIDAGLTVAGDRLTDELAAELKRRT